MSIISNITCILRNIRLPIVPIRYKHPSIDYSRVPVLNEKDIEEQHVRGSGPGGQATNKTSNCVILKHIPTGLVVKCHQTRSLIQNQNIARTILINKLDVFLNNENSVEAQTKRLIEKNSKQKESKKEKLRRIKSEWKKREGLD
ncbi:mitochondrial translation release factor in rescue [Chrysoperla carnea]|uniref:mitochondrial translation release factor in rescue n=1 Tax=Chrysoperla carnea TaxID=189513 RepID=UPI001D068151|nr:mitochondrial translation release factor in rescue [Chrysoperla carnea]